MKAGSTEVFLLWNRNFLNLIKNNGTYLEREPLEKLTKKRELAAFKHEGFWQCMDTKRDVDKLNAILKKKNFEI